MRRRYHWPLWGGVILLLVMAVGCARHTISQSLREQAEPTVSFAELQANPNVYIDEIVIFGGTIVKTLPKSHSTLVTVAQHPIDRYGRPLPTDQTAGRFMASCEAYLDPVVYAPGRQLTVAGRVLGSRPGKVGERDYVYPLISCMEMGLWPAASFASARWSPWHRRHHRHDRHH